VSFDILPEVSKARSVPVFSMKLSIQRSRAGRYGVLCSANNTALLPRRIIFSVSVLINCVCH